MQYIKTSLLLGRNLIFRSLRNPVASGLFALLPVVLLAIFGSIGNNGNDSAAFNTLFATFSGIALLLLGVVGVSTLIPMDKKVGVLRRFHATPLKASQLLLGFAISSLALGVISLLLMTLMAVTFFSFNVAGSYLDLALFFLIGLATSVSIGMAIGGWAKDDTVATFVSQIIFFGSLALSGVWFPRDTLQGALHTISDFMPLTPIIDGVKAITTQGVGLLDLGPQLCVMALWIIISYVIGSRLFRWESNPS